MSTNNYRANNDCRFYPVQGPEEVINSLEPHEGYVYFTTDTKKIFLGQKSEKIPMCSASGFFYGTKDIKYQNNGIEPDPNVLFLQSEIEGNITPEIDDLILNIGKTLKDGCFYRVKGISNKGIATERLTLQGSGPSGPSTNTTSFGLTILEGENIIYSSTATEMNITVLGSYAGEKENHIARISFILNGETFYTVPGPIAFNQEHVIDLIDYKDQFGAIPANVTIKVVDRYGSALDYVTSVSIVALQLDKTAPTLISTSKDNYQYTCKIIGGTSGVSEKQIIYTLYNEKDLTKPITTQIEKLKVTDQGSISTNLKLSDLSHGIYVMKVVAQASISTTGTIIYSNEITHKIGRFVETDPLLLIALPETAEQYVDVPIEYLLITSDSSKEYTLNLKVDKQNQIQLAVKSENAGQENLYFEEKGAYSVTCSILELGNVSYKQTINIIEYTGGNVPVIHTNNLMLHLNPRGKSNNATDRNEWKDSQGIYTAKLNNFYYGTTNGWLTDEDGISYLKMSSGASLVLNQFEPFKLDPTRVNKQDETVGKGMTIELDFEVNGILDYDTELFKCISTNLKGDIQVGFKITGEKANFYNSRLNDGLDAKGNPVGPLTSMKIVEDKRIRLTYVIEPNPTPATAFPMVLTYLNGKLSGATFYNQEDKFEDFSDNSARLIVTADKAQIKLYGIRFYNIGLDDSTILKNYTASLKDREEKQKHFDSNDVFTDNKIDFGRVSNPTYDLQVPYMKLTGGWATETESKWQLKSSDAANAGLPTAKDDYRMVDVEVIYPKNDQFADYQNYKYVNEFANGLTMDKAYGQEAINGGAIMYAQGTSSMEYPVKNLRIRFNKLKNSDNPKQNFYTVDPKIDPVEIICMKADYMESSGSHNTGTGRFVDQLYKSVGMMTPGQEHFATKDKQIVTCIKGYPCLIFYSKDSKGPYEYIGKYNLNLDKATPEPFGFNHDDSDFGYLPEGETYWEVLYAKKSKNYKNPWVGQLDPAEDADYVPGQIEKEKVVEAGQKVNSIHCFEFLDNAVEVCNFLGKAEYFKTNITEADYNNNILRKYYIYNSEDKIFDLATGAFNPNTQYYINVPKNYHDTWYGTYKNKKNEDIPGWTLGFESRYPKDRVGYHDADMLYPLANWLNQLYLLRQQEEENGLKPNDIEEIYKYSRVYTYTEGFSYYTLDENGDYIEVYPTAQDFTTDSEYFIREVERKTFKMQSLERFKQEYQTHFNKEFLLTYYLVTEALLMADSRVKNMMIATWGKEKQTYMDITDGNEKEANNYIFYPIFYDMDTMLGLDNTGVDRFRYYDEDTDYSIYNGEDVLWNFVRDALADDLVNQYGRLEKGSLNAADMLVYYNDKQANVANEAFYNGDARYKYIDPARDGYDDLLNGEHIDPGVGPYLYAAQGDRSLTRELFLSNRMRYLQGKYKSSKYQSGNRIHFRWYCPKGSGSDEALNLSSQAVPPDGLFEFTSLKTGYAGVILGANGSLYDKRFDDEETTTITLPNASGANGTEAYLVGLNTLSNLGDLSNKYMQKFIISSDDVRLEHLILGNEHKDYYNPYWKPNAGQSLTIGLSGCKYLKTFNLQNCSSYNSTLDFSNSPIIEKIQLIGSGVTGIKLPVNGVISELRLPPTITSIRIESQAELEEEGFTIGHYVYDDDYKDDRGYVIMGGNGYYQNDFSSVAELYVTNTKINTYEIVRQAAAAGAFKTYHLEGIDWEITNGLDEWYCRRTLTDFDDDGKLVEGRNYYTYDFDNKVYNKYTDAYYPEDGTILYEKVVMLNDKNQVTCIPVLEYLQTRNTYNGEAATSLFGTITLNVPGASADELAIYKKYVDIFPNVVIKYSSQMNVDEAYRINFYNIDWQDESVSTKEGLEAILSQPGYVTFLTTEAEGKTLAQLLQQQNNFVLPARASTQKHTYSFTGVWHDLTIDNSLNIKDTPYYQDDIYAGDTSGLTTLFSSVKPTKSLALFPEFTEHLRMYNVTFHKSNKYWNPDNIEITDVINFQASYESTLHDAMINYPECWYVYDPDADNGLNANESFRFQGWISEQDYKNNKINPTRVDVGQIPVVEDMNFYAYFEKEDVTKTPSIDTLYSITDGNSNASDKPAKGKTIVSKQSLYGPGLYSVVGGKITLPCKDDSHNPILYIGLFSAPIWNVEKKTAVYFLNDSNYVGIVDKAFEGNSERSLDKIYLPDTIQVIGNEAFKNNFALTIDKLPDNLDIIGRNAFDGCKQLSIDKLPDNLSSLGISSFAKCEKLKLTKLPDRISDIPNYCFNGCHEIEIDEIGENEQKITIGSGAFADCQNLVTKFYLGKNVVIDEGCASSNYHAVFASDGYPNLQTVYCDKSSYAGCGSEEELRLRLFGTDRDTSPAIESLEDI